jgi:hypothetical protein
MLYDDMKKIAADVLREFAQGSDDTSRMSYIEIVPGNGSADDAGPSTRVVHPIKGAARGVKFQYVDGSTVIAGDMQCTMPADGIEPKISGFVRIGTVDYKLVKVMPVPPVGTPVIYRLFFGKR